MTDPATQTPEQQHDAPFDERLQRIADRAKDLLTDLARAAQMRLDTFLHDVSDAYHIYVYPVDEGGWRVLTQDGESSDVIESKTLATERARDMARNSGSTLVIHREDGSVQSTYHYPNPQPEDADS